MNAPRDLPMMLTRTTPEEIIEFQNEALSSGGLRRGRGSPPYPPASSEISASKPVNELPPQASGGRDCSSLARPPHHFLWFWVLAALTIVGSGLAAEAALYAIETLTKPQ